MCNLNITSKYIMFPLREKKYNLMYEISHISSLYFKIHSFNNSYLDVYSN